MLAGTQTDAELATEVESGAPQINAGEGVARRGPSHTAGGNVNRCSRYGEQPGRFLKNLKAEPPCDPAVLLPGACLGKSTASEGRTRPSAQCSTVPNSKTWGQPECPSVAGAGGDVVCSRSAVLLSHEKKEGVPSAATWIDVEMVTPGEVSQTEKQNHCTTSLRCRI